ncbi:MAG: CPBP family intramembrane metalloprotease [Cyclobacteriaceae bacterium]|nr:CPBP family intramembrane metalloprotease [Cyclobacteriaceae bacterium]
MNQSTSLSGKSFLWPKFSHLNSRLALAVLLCLVALTIPLIISAYVKETIGLERQQQVYLQALMVSCFVVLGIWQMRVRLDRGTPMSIGLGTIKSAILKFAFGFCLLVVPLLITLLISNLAGWGKVTFNWGTSHLGIILLGMLSTFLTDAFPEELVFRGYIFSNLLEKFSKWKSAIITTTLFVLFPVLIFPIQKLLFGPSVMTGVVTSVSVGYMTYMLFFGAFAIYLRVLTKSIWTGVGFHLMFVFINQLIGLQPNNLIQLSEITSETPLQITFVTMLLLTFIALIVYPKIKSLRSNLINSNG